MWERLEKLGPTCKRVKIPEEVVTDEKSYFDLDHILNKWKEDFSKLYTGLTHDANGYDNEVS